MFLSTLFSFSGRTAGPPFFSARSKTYLKQCDHTIAASALMHHLIDHHPTPALAAALETYFAHPTYQTALPVLAADPSLILLFRESRQGGIYHRCAISS